MRQYFPRLWYDPYPFHAPGLGLCFFLVSWSVICCQDGCLMAFAKGALPEEYLSHNFDEEYLGGHRDNQNGATGTADNGGAPC